MDEKTAEEVQRTLNDAWGSIQTIAQSVEVVHPYAITVVSEGEGQILGTDPGMEVEEAIALIYKTLEDVKAGGTLVSFAVMTDVTLTNSDTGEELDAIHIAIEHRSPCALGLVVPYKKVEGGKSFAEPQRVPHEGRVFV